MKNEDFEKDIVSASAIYNKLHIVESNDERYLKGELDIVDLDGCLIDSYQIEIKGSDTYPYRFPFLFETGNAFPKDMTWHVNQDGTCCIDVRMRELILCKTGINVVDYIKLYAIPYFANQSHRIREGYYLYGEYSHGALGFVEYYQNRLKARNPVDLLKMFDLIINGYNPKRPAYCPFCHKTKFRHCHKKVFQELYQFKRTLHEDGLLLVRLFKSQPNYELPKAVGKPA